MSSRAVDRLDESVSANLECLVKNILLALSVCLWLGSAQKTQAFSMWYFIKVPKLCAGKKREDIKQGY